MASQQLTGLQQLGVSVTAVKDFISKSYMQQLSDIHCQVLAVKDPEKARVGIRMLKVHQLAISDELIESRLTSVYQTMKQLVNSCFLIIQGTAQDTSMYIGFHSNAPGTAEKALIQTLTGNFPGIVIESLNAPRIQSVMASMKSDPVSGLKTVSAVSVVPSPRSEQGETADVQGMEKFMDTMQGKEFTAIILATPYSTDAVNQRILALENIFTALSSLEKISLQDSQSSSLSLTDSTAKTVSNSISTNISQAFTVGTTTGSFRQSGSGHGFSISPLGLGLSFTGQSGSGTSSSQNQGQTQSTGASTSIGNSSTLSQAYSAGQSKTTTIIKTETNKEIQNLLQKVDRQIQRLRESEAHGLWDCCGYFIANANDTAIVAANSFQGIVTGDSTHVEQSAVALWQPTPKQMFPSNHGSIQNLVDCLQLGVAPLFCVGNTIQRTESIVTGKELSRMMSFPRKSTGNVSVIRMASFGRNVHLIGGGTQDRSSPSNFSVGKVMHMGKVEPHTPVHLDLQSLNAHTFATGATGVGKTTSICGILGRLYENGIPFTVIEPAKGEYGEIWGKLPGVEVYSTSPFRYRMLRLNPFAFEENVHILDHMERLISVFSTAWPLYAAQPAILRDCVRMAYVRCGWDIRNSICLKKPKRFPTFADVLHQLPIAIRNSKFVGESKGTYEGALQTRLSMLTEGIFGELLGECDIPNEELFDKTVIIDLSRLGSPETLSLIMGFLLIRLYEHRLKTGKTAGLTHVTVLEEAHNILKRNAGMQVSEDGPSSGAKAVEVLTKCITELRFTGEGFIIADQSPGEVDSTAIKNTSTKIVMRLQDASDQQAVGAAMGLTELQISELSRLDKGAAVVFQEGWNEPVLTKFDPYQSPFSAAGDADYDADVNYADVCDVRAFLLQEVLRQYRAGTYSLPLYERIIRCIKNFSRWKLADYRSLFLRHNATYLQIQQDFSSNRVRFPFYGKLIMELLDCADLFEIFPIPLPTKEMALPYSEDPRFYAACVQWKAEFCEALDLYCSSLSAEDKSLLTKLLLLADGTENANRIRVQATLNKKGK